METPLDVLSILLAFLILAKLWRADGISPLPRPQETEKNPGVDSVNLLHSLNEGAFK